VHVAHSDSPCIMLHRLQSRTRYAVHVCAVLDGIASTPSEQVVVLTMPAPPEDGPQPAVEVLSHASVLVTWPSIDLGPDTGTLVAYSVQRGFVAEGEGAPRSWSGVYKGHNNGCIVDSLLPGRLYAFRVRVHCGTGRGRWGPDSCARTCVASPAPPCSIGAEARTARSVCVSWSHSDVDGRQHPAAFQCVLLSCMPGDVCM
jgi:hypothetical protein